MIHATSTSGDQVPWGRTGPDYLCDAGSESCGSHHQSGHGCFSVSWRPFHLYLQTGGIERRPLFLRKLFGFLPSALLLTECDPIVSLCSMRLTSPGKSALL